MLSIVLRGEHCQSSSDVKSNSLYTMYRFPVCRCLLPFAMLIMLATQAGMVQAIRLSRFQMPAGAAQVNSAV
jgi:hypothetical protein